MINLNTSGIYQILNLITGMIYIGSATNFRLRWTVHKSYLNLNKHGNRLLQRAWDKYGEAAFEFSILEIANKSNLLICEQTWINWTLSNHREFGYNLRNNARSNFGLRWSEETKAKMSLAGKERQKPSEESRKKMSAWQVGRKMSDEAKAKMSIARGKRITKDETRIKLSKAGMGRNHSEESKRKMSLIKTETWRNKKLISKHASLWEVI